MSSKSVCQYYLRGTCRFGDRCMNQHPPGEEGSLAGGSKFGASPWGQSNTASAASSKPPVEPFTLQSIQNDLDYRVEKPQWPLSSYAPGKHEASLITGIDESPEELRVKYYEAQRTNTMDQYNAYEASKLAEADTAVARVTSNFQAAYEHAKSISASPYFIDKKPSSFGPSTTSTFGATSRPSAFGSSTFGATSTPSAFGASTSGAGGFGTTGFASRATPAFGQTGFGTSSNPPAAPSGGGGFAAYANQPTSFSALASSTAPTSAFGSTTAAPAFGQTGFGNVPIGPRAQQPVFGQSGFGGGTAPPTSAFGQTSTPTSAFGASSFGAPANRPSAFGSTATLSQGGGFAAFANQTPAMGATSFGQPQQPAAAPAQPTSAFATQSSFSQPRTSAFGQTPAATPISFTPPVTSSTPNSDPYAPLLPSNYLESLPKRVRDAFEKEEFEWGAVPDWIPPVELRH